MKNTTKHNTTYMKFIINDEITAKSVLVSISFYAISNINFPRR